MSAPMTTGHPVPKQLVSNKRQEPASTLVAIPVFNEAEYVDDVLREVRRYAGDILLVNDGSTDGTSQVLAKHGCVRVISHKKNIGYGRSLIDAFRFAVGNDFDWMITLDCDHQHEPSYIPRFYDEIKKGDADIISGSRYLKKICSGSVPPPAERVAINGKTTEILNRSLGIDLTDAFCGFKAYRVEPILKLSLTETGYGLPLQLWIRAARAGLRIREISVPLIYHDPKRNFSGALEEPEIRFDYYIKIIEKELGYNVSQNIREPFHRREEQSHLRKS